MTAAAPTGTAITFQNVGFVIPSGLALGATGEAVPEVTETTGAPWDVAPAHIRFTLNGYNDSLAKFSEAFIKVYPAQGDTSWAGNSLPSLQALLASPSAPLDAKSLPGVPGFNAAQMVAAQVTRINFIDGAGIRMVTQYGQAVMPITNRGTFYHFQGLTSDGKYYIVAVLPIGAPFLPNEYDTNAPTPPGGVAFPDINNTDVTVFDNYFQAVTGVMNAAGPNTYSPTLPMLDALVQSITVTP